MSALPVASEVEHIANPDMVTLALRRRDAGLRHHLPPDRFPGATVLVPLGPSGQPVVTESFRTVPVFSDLEALKAWAQPPFGFPPDPELEPAVAGVGALKLPDGVDELLAGGAYVVVFNPEGPGASHLAGVVGEPPLRPSDFEDPPVEKRLLGRPKGASPDGPRVKLADRPALRDKLAQPLHLGLAAAQAGQVEQALKTLKQADHVARQMGAWVTASTAALHAARVQIHQGDRDRGSALANLAARGSNLHAKPRLQLEGTLIVAENLAFNVNEGRSVAAGAAAWTADWLRRLADVAVEQGSMSVARQAELYGRADAIGRTYNDPVNEYEPDRWTPEGWVKAEDESESAR
jgi:hypothetical protein